ncbi:MAG: pilus assembly protein PilM, partial [Armatimonadota bacterium]
MSAKQAFKSFSQRVGLDIGSHTVKGVEVAERGSEIVIRSAAAVPIPGVRSRTDPPDYGSVIQAIKTLWSSAGFQSKAAAMGLSADSVYLKWLHLEAASPEELDTTARAAAARGAPF